MTTNRKLMLTFIVGAAIGAIAATQIRAQTKAAPPAFFVSEATIHDPQLYQKFLATEQPAPTMGGRQLVRGGRVVAIEGEPAPPPRIAIAMFESVEAAQRWALSPGHVEAMKLYHQAADGRTFIVEGVAP
jgi:uncharacterized protein (DUF1330 family)